MQPDRARATVAAAGALLSAAVPGLLARMRADFEATGGLATATIARMYTAYGIHATAVAIAARHRLGPLPIRSRAIDAVAAVTGAAGVALTITGMQGFDSARHVSGGSHPRLTTGGVYAVTRNPQYVGTVAALGSLAVLRRSLVVAGLAAGYAAVIRVWVSVEEATLERLFGDAYRHYRHRVPRWIGPFARNGR